MNKMSRKKGLVCCLALVFVVASCLSVFAACKPTVYRHEFELTVHYYNKTTKKYYKTEKKTFVKETDEEHCLRDGTKFQCLREDLNSLMQDGQWTQVCVTFATPSDSFGSPSKESTLYDESEMAQYNDGSYVALAFLVNSWNYSGIKDNAYLFEASYRIAVLVDVSEA